MPLPVLIGVTAFQVYRGDAMFFPLQRRLAPSEVEGFKETDEYRRLSSFFEEAGKRPVPSSDHVGAAVRRAIQERHR